MISQTPANQPPKEPDIVVIHDARAVHDIASLRLENFMVQGRPTWVVAIVIPGPRSGSANIPGAYINGATGEFVAPQNSEPVVLKEGRWRALAISEQAAASEGTYSWSEPIIEKRKLAPEDYYSPFARGGTILLSRTPDATGLEQLGAVYLLFHDWDQYAAPAFTFISSHPALLADDHVGPSELAQLAQLLSESNKVLAVLAFRGLVGSGQMDPNLAGNQLRQAGSNLAAVYTYLILVTAKDDPHQLSQHLIKVSLKTNDATKLRSFALGAFAAGLFQSVNSRTVSNSKLVLGAVKQRLKALRIPVESDAYLASIFEKMGV